MKNNLFHYDLHTHTNLSDGRSPVKDMVNAAQANGVLGMALTDHVFNDEQAETLLAEYGKIDRASSPIKLVCGCETAVRDVTGRPCARRELLEKFDLVLMDCNGILFNKIADGNTSKESLRDILCEVMVKACENPEVDILAHPFNFGLNPLNLRLENFDNERVDKIAQAFKRNNKIFEIMNQMYFWHGNVNFEDFHREYMRILEIMKSHGVRFSIGSDAHSCCGVGCLMWSERAASELGVADDLFLPDQLRAKK